LGGQCLSGNLSLPPTVDVCQYALGDAYVTDNSSPSLCNCGAAGCCLKTLNECEQHGGLCISGFPPVPPNWPVQPYACDQQLQSVCTGWQCYIPSASTPDASTSSDAAVVVDAGVAD
jgi:hypothetical protein